MTVFVVQKQMRFDHEKGELVPRFPSIHLAEEYGELRYLLSPSAQPFDPDHIMPDINDKLRGFSSGDYLLLIGNPILIGMATTVAAMENSGFVRFLQWSGREQRYVSVEAQIF